jgi:hypothetical protein
MANNNKQLVGKVARMVKIYGVEKMADELEKRPSSLYSELRECEWAKLGLRDFLQMIHCCLSNDAPVSCDVLANEILDDIDAQFGRVGHKIPEIKASSTDLLEFISYLSKEFADDIHTLAEAVKQGTWSSQIIQTCLKENLDLQKASFELHAVLKAMAKQEGVDK